MKTTGTPPNPTKHRGQPQVKEWRRLPDTQQADLTSKQINSEMIRTVSHRLSFYHFILMGRVKNTAGGLSLRGLLVYPIP